MVFFFFFKQKTAYEMRISDWSSDVCSSDLVVALAIHAMSFGLQNIFLLDRQFIVLIHMPNCRTGAEQSTGSRCEKMLLHLCLPQTALAAITETLRIFIRDRKSTRLNSSH